MVLSPTNWLRGLGLLSRQPAKRTPLSRQRWGCQAESLEERALLSATSVAPDTTPADVSDDGRAAVEYPQVAGTWDVEAEGLGSNTATIVQHRGRLIVTIDVPDVGVIKLRGKFDKQNPSEFNGKARAKLPEVGRVKITAHVAFDGDSFFSGTMTIGSDTIPVVGTKQMVGQSLVGDGRAATPAPDVTGNWLVEGDVPEVGQVGVVLNITQTGRTGRVIHATTDLPEGASLKFTGRFKGSAGDTIKGTAVLKLPEQPVIRVKFLVTLGDDNNSFTGTATVRKIGTVEITGTRGII